MFRGAALFQKVNNKHMLAQNQQTDTVRGNAFVSMLLLAETVNEGGEYRTLIVVKKSKSMWEPTIPGNAHSIG